MELHKDEFDILAVIKGPLLGFEGSPRTEGYCIQHEC